MNLKRLKNDGQLAWNAAGKFLELFAIFILTLLITLLMALADLLGFVRTWIEGGHPMPAWLSFRRKECPYCKAEDGLCLTHSVEGGE